MTDLHTTSQIATLARLLDTDPAELSSLARLGAEDIRHLESGISNVLFDSLATIFKKVSTLAPLIPDTVVVAVVRKAIPPEAAGRVGGALALDHPQRIASILASLDAEYLAAATPFVDPRVIPGVMPDLPVELIVPVARELLARGDFHTAARFLECSTDGQVRGYADGVSDDNAMTRAIALVSSGDQLNAVVRAVPAARATSLIESAATADPDTVLAALLILTRLDEHLAAPLAHAMITGTHVKRITEIAAGAGALTELEQLCRFLPDTVTALIAPVLSANAGAGEVS